MNKRTCTQNNCDDAATWTVTIDGHPNVTGVQTWAYCAAHILAHAPVWDESPLAYSVTLRGPFKEGMK